MNMKKILAATAAAGMLLSGCSKPADTTTTANTTANSTASTTAAPAGDAKTVKVGVSIYQFADSFMTLYRTELEKYLEGLSDDKVKYVVDVMDAKNDQAEQTNQIDNFIQQKYDLLIINLVQSTSASTVIDKVAEAGIPTVFINRQPSDEDMKAKDGTDFEGMYAYVGADARQSGKFQGEIIADLPNKGDLNGDGKLQYVMVVGDPENVDAKYRTEFSVSQYKEKSGLDVEKLDEQRGDWKREEGQKIVANALSQYGDKIEVVFCNNDDMAIGAVQSIKDARRTVGKDIYIVGVDALEEAQQLVKAGGMTGTVLNDHIGQSHKAADLGIELLNGKKADAEGHVYMVDYIKVTQ